MNTVSSHQLAEQDFDHASRKVFWRDLHSKLTRKSNQLLAFDQIHSDLPFDGQHYGGLQTICLDDIVGSEGRSQDFDRAFFPRESHTKDRWISIDEAYYQETPLPPIDLLKVGEGYFVRDGNHRVSVARAHKQAFIDAFVIEVDLSDSHFQNSKL